MPFVPFISAQIHQRQQAGRRRGRHLCPRRAAQRPPRPWSPHNWWMGLTGTASGAPYATLWATCHRHGFEVSYNIMALTDATSFLRRACGAQVACYFANDWSSLRSSPPEPTINAIYIWWGGVGDDGLPSFSSRCQRHARCGSSMLMFRADFETLSDARFRRFRVLGQALNELRSLVILALGPQAS